MNFEIKIPESWKSVNIENVTIPPLKTNKKKEDSSEQFLYIDISSIDNQIQRIEEPKSYTWKDAPSRAQQILKTGDTVFSTVRPYLKNIALVDERLNNQIASTGFCVVRPIQIPPKYLYYFLTTNSFIQKVNRLAKGTSYPAVTNQVVYDQELPLPPLNEQHRIVEKIEELFSELDNGIANLQLAQQQLKVYRQSLLKAAFEGKLTEEWRKQHNPEPAEKLLERIKAERQARYEREMEEWKAAVKDWEKGGKEGKRPAKPKIPMNLDYMETLEVPDLWSYTALGNICKNIDKTNKKLNDPQREFLYIDISAIDNTTFKIISPKKYLWSDAPSRAQQIVKVGDTVFSTVRTYLKNIALVTDSKLDNQICSTGFVVLRPEKYINNKYLFYFTLSNDFIEKLNALQTGTSYPAIRDNDAFEQGIPICSKQEQDEIINLLEERFSIIDKMESTIEGELQKAELNRQSILKKAFEGKLVAQDSKDEPASVLLERIKEEKEKYIEEQKRLKKKRSSIQARKKPELIEIIREVFKDKEFDLQELRKHTELSSMALKNRLMKLLDNDLQSVYDKVEKKVKYRLVK